MYGFVVFLSVILILTHNQSRIQFKDDIEWFNCLCFDSLRNRYYDDSSHIDLWPWYWIIDSVKLKCVGVKCRTRIRCGWTWTFNYGNGMGIKWNVSIDAKNNNSIWCLCLQRIANKIPSGKVRRSERLSLDLIFWLFLTKMWTTSFDWRCEFAIEMWEFRYFLGFITFQQKNTNHIISRYIKK